jgi:hypothetical protein
MPCCFIDRIQRIEATSGKCSIRIADWHPANETRNGCQVTLLLAENDSEYGHGDTWCEALADLEAALSILPPADCDGCER